MSLHRLARHVQQLERFLLGGAILGLAFSTCLNVFSRTAFGHSLAWAEELSQMLMVLLTFVGLSYAASQGRHIRMTAFFDQLPQRRRRQLMVWIAASTSALLAALAVVAGHYVGTQWVLGTRSPALQLPLYLSSAVAPLGLALASVQYALTALRNLSEEEVYLSALVRESGDARAER